MAVYACDYSRHRYREQQQSVYFTQVLNDSADTYAMRLCPEHLELVDEGVQAVLAELDNDAVVSEVCESCSGAREGALYAKVYRKGRAVEEFAADFCAACLSRVGNHLRIYNGRHLTAR